MDFNDFYEKYYKRSVMFASKYTNGDLYIAEDVVQESFIKLYTKENYKDRWNWICVIIKNSCIDYIRKANRVKNNLNDFKYSMKVSSKIIDNNYDIIECFDKNKLDNDIATKYINKLTPSYRKVITKFFIENKPHRVIASELNISENTSKSNLHKAKMNLKKILDKNNISIN